MKSKELQQLNDDIKSKCKDCLFISVVPTGSGFIIKGSHPNSRKEGELFLIMDGPDLEDLKVNFIKEWNKRVLKYAIR